MARHQLTPEQQIKGLEKALENPKTPKQLRPSMIERLEKLRASSGTTARGSR